MKNLIFELVMGLASDQTKISSVNILSHACVVVTRGENLPYKALIDLKAMTNLAGGRQARLIVPKEKPSMIASARAKLSDWLSGRRLSGGLVK
jgi:hypothetical protein